MPRKKNTSKKVEIKEEKAIQPAKDITNKQLYYIVGMMILTFIILLIAVVIAQSANKLKYEGLTFTKEKIGQIDIYHYYYNFKGQDNQQYKYNLYLRGDPRNSNTTVQGKIFFGDGVPPTYISLNTTGLVHCSSSTLAISGLASFLTDNLIPVKGATLNLNESIEKNITYASCLNNENNNVIEITTGDRSLIESNGVCHKITVANCEVLDATEKFEVQAILDAKTLAANLNKEQ